VAPRRLASSRADLGVLRNARCPCTTARRNSPRISSMAVVVSDASPLICLAALYRCAEIRASSRFANSIHRLGANLEPRLCRRTACRPFTGGSCANGWARPFCRRHIVSCRPSPAYRFQYEAQTVQSPSQIGYRPKGDFTHLRRNVIRDTFLAHRIETEKAGTHLPIVISHDCDLAACAARSAAYQVIVVFGTAQPATLRARVKESGGLFR
jgi:hypothetical protein